MKKRFHLMSHLMHITNPYMIHTKHQLVHMNPQHHNTMYRIVTHTKKKFLRMYLQKFLSNLHHHTIHLLEFHTIHHNINGVILT